MVAGRSRDPHLVELLTVETVTITMQRKQVEMTGRLVDGSIIHRKFHEHSGITVPEPKGV